jgi:acyl carrier protein
MATNTLEDIKAMLVEEFGLPAEQVRPETKLTELGVDSLATIEFIFLLEDRYKLKFDGDPATVETVGDIAAEIDRLLAEPVLSVAA